MQILGCFERIGILEIHLVYKLGSIAICKVPTRRPLPPLLTLFLRFDPGSVTVACFPEDGKMFDRENEIQKISFMGCPGFH